MEEYRIVNDTILPGVFQEDDRAELRFRVMSTLIAGLKLLERNKSSAGVAGCGIPLNGIGLVFEKGPLSAGPRSR